MASIQTRQISFGKGDFTNTSSVTTGIVGSVIMPFDFEITGWGIACAGSSPTITFDVWKIATGTAVPTVSNSIMGTRPALSTGNVVSSTTMTNWVIRGRAGDILFANIDSVSNATSALLTLNIKNI